MQKVLLLVNPCAGKMKSRKELFSIADPFCAAGYEVTIRPTTCRGDATVIARDRGPEFDLLVCCGGDGTLNETVSGLLQIEESKRPQLGYIPTGSTNDFASTLGIPSDINTAVRAILQNHTRTIDIGTLNGRIFAYVATFGAFSDASYSAPQSLKNKLGHSAYLLEGTFKSTRNIRPYHIKIEAGDFVEEGDYVYGSISNATSVGGLVKFDPNDVKLDDGIFEIMLVKVPKSVPDFLNTFRNVVISRNFDDHNITFIRAKDVHISVEDDMPWSLDGEYEKGAKEVHIVNHKEALTLQVGLTL